MSTDTQHLTHAHRPVITLLSDFGNRDGYVAQMKLAILSHCPSAQLVDVSHEIPPQDLLAGSIVLQQVIAGAMHRTVHLAVVDPGVGTDRKLIIALIAGQWIVCPDNGLITWAWHRHAPRIACELIWRPAQSSHTFHGRDILGPVAGMIASGADLKPLMGSRVKPVLLPTRPAKPGAMHGKVIHIDHFGNAMTNITAEALDALAQAMKGDRGKNVTRLRIAAGSKRSSHSIAVARSGKPSAVQAGAGATDSAAVQVTYRKIHVTAGGKSLGLIRRAYGDVAPGQPLALIASAGLLEIAVAHGSAARDLDLSVGDAVELALADR